MINGQVLFKKGQQVKTVKCKSPVWHCSCVYSCTFIRVEFISATVRLFTARTDIHTFGRLADAVATVHWRC